MVEVLFGSGGELTQVASVNASRLLRLRAKRAVGSDDYVIDSMRFLGGK